MFSGQIYGKAWNNCTKMGERCKDFLPFLYEKRKFLENSDGSDQSDRSDPSENQQQEAPSSSPMRGSWRGLSLSQKSSYFSPSREWPKTALVFLLSLARSLSHVATIRLLANAIRLPADSLIVSADTIRKLTHRSRTFLSAFGLKIAERGQFLQEKAVSLNV